MIIFAARSSRVPRFLTFVLAACLLLTASTAGAACAVSMTTSVSGTTLTATVTGNGQCGASRVGLYLDDVAFGGAQCSTESCTATATRSTTCLRTGTHRVTGVVDCHEVENNQCGTAWKTSFTEALIDIDSTPTLTNLSFVVDPSGQGTVSVDYNFPNTSTSSQRLLGYYLDDVWQGVFYHPLDAQGTWTFNRDAICWKSGPYRLMVTAITCDQWEQSPPFNMRAFAETTLNLDSTPLLNVQVQETGSTHRADVQYEFPHSPDNAEVGRRIRLRAWDARDTLRVDQTLSPTMRSATWPAELDTSCWADGPARVEVQAWCQVTDVVTREQTFVVRNQPDVKVGVRDHPDAGPKARVTWEFPRTAGNVRVVMIVPPSAAEIEIADFTADTLSGLREYPFTPPVEARTVTIQARASGSVACHYDDDAVAYACTCRTVGDPVDIADGNMRYSDADPLPSGGAFGFSRVYDSRQRIVGRFGEGWTSAFDARITLNRPFSVIVVTENNEPYVFVEKGAVGATFEQRWPRDAARGRLIHDAGSGIYAFTPAGGGRTWIYTASTGRLAEIHDLGSDRAVRFAYDAAGLPASVSDSWEAWSWTVTTNASTGLVQTIAVDGRPDLAWSYEYNTDKRLLRAVAPGAVTWRTYDYSAGPMTEARDAAGKLIESHTYDTRGWATSSRGPSGEISGIAYALPGSSADETITRVTSAAGAVTNYRMRLEGGTLRPVKVEGGCASCGGAGDGTTVYDAFGLVARRQDARGYVTTFTYEPLTRRLVSRTAYQRPSTCDPETSTTSCVLNVDSLRTSALVGTSATTTTSYEYNDPNWPERPTAVVTESVLNALQTRREAMTYELTSGSLLSRAVTGWTGDPVRSETRTEATVLYSGEVAAFDPGGPFDPAWMLLPQPMRQRKSIDGSRTDVVDMTSFVYYPTHPTVPATSRGRLAATRDPMGHITRFERYDVFGNAERVVDPNGVATGMTFDGLGRPLTTITKGVTGCDTSGDPLCGTDVTTSRAYAGAGPLEMETMATGGVTVYGYDERGRVETVSRGPSTTDLRERMKHEYSPEHGRKSVERHQAREGTTWSDKKVESYLYAIDGELEKITHADDPPTSIHYTYDAMHRVASVRDEDHAQPNTQYAYDPAGRLNEVVQILSTATGGSINTKYEYDLHGNLAMVEDPNGNQTIYQYDDFGQMIRQTSPVTGTTTYAYDLAGNLQSTTDANGATTERTFDEFGRPETAISTRSWAVSETVSWAYDQGSFGKGRLSSMTDPAGTTTYGYERRGLLTSEARAMDALIFTTTYKYNADGNRSYIGYPTGKNVFYGFDYSGRPTSATSVYSGVDWVHVKFWVTSAEYLPFGPLKQFDFERGMMRRVIEYDNRYRVLSNTLVGSAGNLARYEYGYDGRGNVTSISDVLDSNYDRNFGYDDLNRLTSAKGGPVGVDDTWAGLWGNATYSYDAMGNIKTATLGEAPIDSNPAELNVGDPRARPLSRRTNFSYVGTTSELDRVAEWQREVSTEASRQSARSNELSWGRQVIHDEAGNETDFLVKRDYSPRNLQAKVIDLSSESDPQHMVQYGFDGRGVRVSRTESPASEGGGSATRYYFYSPELQLLAVTQDNAANAWAVTATRDDFIWFAGSPVAQENPYGHRFTFTDHLGTPIIQTNQYGSIVWQAEYEPFGNIYAMRVGDRQDQPLRFPGQDVAMNWEGTEENYNIFRWYKTGWGRYAQRDPLGLDGGVNLYSYALGNPVAWSDPLGLRVQLYCHPIGAGGPSRLRRTIGRSGFGHCFVRVKCCDPAYDKRLEITGRRPSNGPDDGSWGEIPMPPPGFAQGHNSSIVPIAPSDNDDNDCAAEDCIRKKYEQLFFMGYEYPATGYLAGPNSNTFANELLTSCGFRVVQWPDGIPPYN